MRGSLAKHWRNGTLWTAIARKARMPFQLRPTRKRRAYSSYTYSHLHKGREYHAGFSTSPGRRMIWQLEQEILESIAAERGPFSSHLDFAGGTGRIAAIMKRHCTTQYVLDVSQEMLAVAKENVPGAKLIQRDFNEGVPEIAEASQHLVTAFRFFPNAEPDLRNGAMRFIASRLKPGGHLICNNHRNFWSVPYVTQRLTFCGGTEGMTNEEMVSLARAHGLSLERRYSMGVLPQTEASCVLPWALAERLERSVFRRVGTRHRLGYDVVFVFERA